MRLFLAIEIPDEAKRHLDRVQDFVKPKCAAVSWVKLENRHVTLKFLGEIAETRIMETTDAMESVLVEPMSLFTERMQYFPRRGPVHVISVGMGGDLVRVNQLHADVEEALEGVGIAPEARRYTPHITLGRSRNGERLRGLTLDDEFPGPSFVAREFVLMESRLRPEGSEYIVLARFGAK